MGRATAPNRMRTDARLHLLPRHRRSAAQHLPHDVPVAARDGAPLRASAERDRSRRRRRLRF
jgi:hypothetical protein